MGTVKRAKKKAEPRMLCGIKVTAEEQAAIIKRVRKQWEIAWKQKYDNDQTKAET